MEKISSKHSSALQDGKKRVYSDDSAGTAAKNAFRIREVQRQVWLLLFGSIASLRLPCMSRFGLV